MSARIHFGHCIGCDEPIRPPYLTFTVIHARGDGGSLTEWDDVDVCANCAASLTVSELDQLVTADEGASA